jgi:hypothetical protein
MDLHNDLVSLNIDSNIVKLVEELIGKRDNKLIQKMEKYKFKIDDFSKQEYEMGEVLALVNINIDFCIQDIRRN